MTNPNAHASSTMSLIRRAYVAILVLAVLLAACEPPWQTKPDPTETPTLVPVPTPNIYGRDRGCEADILPVEESAKPIAVSVDWGDGAMTAGVLPLHHTYSRNGNYTVTISGQDDLAGWTSGTASIITDCNAPSTEAPPSDSVQPPPAQSFEARVRYILADAQLGQVIHYYRAHPDDAVNEALRRWDAGIRVANPQAFERKNLGDQGWKVVYAGSEAPIDGMDVILTEASTTYCGNPYWPIAQGATWRFQSMQNGSGLGEQGPYQETWTITEVRGDAQNASFTVHVTSTSGVVRDDMFVCNPQGIFQQFADVSGSPTPVMFLFPEADLIVGKQWASQPPATMVIVEVLGLPSVTVPAGTFQTARIRSQWGSGGPDVDFARSVGPVHVVYYTDLGGAWQTLELSLESFEVPNAAAAAAPQTQASTSVQIQGVVGIGNLLDETVVLLNPGNPVDLNGWALEDGTETIYFFPAVTLGTGGTLRVHSMQGPDTPTDLYRTRQPWQAAVWSPGKTVTLRDASGVARSSFVVPAAPAADPMRLWAENVHPCSRQVKVNGVLVGVEGPWRWDWGDGTKSTGWFPQTHSYASENMYTIRVTSPDGSVINAVQVWLQCRG